MNVSELKAGQDLYLLGQEQGWSQSTWLSILHDFVTLKQLNTELLAYCHTLIPEESQP